jgi:hypothetical protein
LPVSLLQFLAAEQNGTIALEWHTANETGVVSYGVERSTDGRTFVALGTVKAKGTNRANAYSFTDKQPLSPLNYYRLSIVDSDGSTRYSKVLLVKTGSLTKMELYPNPAQTWITVRLTPGGDRLTIRDSEGRMLKELRVHPAQASYLSIDINDLPNGLYWVQCGRESIRFVKQ